MGKTNLVDAKARLTSDIRPRKAVAIAELQALTSQIKSQPVSAAELVRAIRDNDRY